MNRSRKELLREQIEALDAEEQAQIFDIVKKYTEEYTKTQSGVLVSSDNLPDACLQDMDAMVKFYRDQHKRMDVDAAERKQYESAQR
jgi:ABC-type dipeptide/oligopeptide/nickel transport system ATPase subunit